MERLIGPCHTAGIMPLKRPAGGPPTSSPLSLTAHTLAITESQVESRPFVPDAALGSSYPCTA